VAKKARDVVKSVSKELTEHSSLTEGTRSLTTSSKAYVCAHMYVHAWPIQFTNLSTDRNNMYIIGFVSYYRINVHDTLLVIAVTLLCDQQTSCK